MSIDEEIDLLLAKLSKEHKSKGANTGTLQLVTLGVHAKIERLLEERLLLELQKVFQLKEVEKWRKMKLWLFPLFGYVSYMNKVDIILSYDDGFTEYANAARRINTLRNEFAHSSSDVLAEKYSTDKPKGKEAVRNLLRSLDQGYERVQEYLAKAEPEVKSSIEEIQDNMTGVFETLPAQGRFAEVVLKKPLKKLTIAKSADSERLDDFVLWNGMIVAIDENDQPLNELLQSALALTGGMFELKVVED